MLLKTIFNAVFYSSLLPLGVLISIFSIMLFYWQEKVNTFYLDNFNKIEIGTILGGPSFIRENHECT